MTQWSPPAVVVVAVEVASSDTLVSLRIPADLHPPLAPAWLTTSAGPLLHLDAVTAEGVEPGVVTFRTEELAGSLVVGETYGFQQWWTPEALGAVTDVSRAWDLLRASDEHRHCLLGWETIQQGVGEDTGWHSQGDWICRGCYQRYIVEDHLRVRPGCGFCHDWQNRNFGHLEYLAEDASGIWLLRCPRCRTLYQDDSRADPIPVSLVEAQARWHHENLGGPDSPS